MHKSQSLFNLTTALHVSGVTITHLQEHKTTVTTASGNRYTVIDKVKLIIYINIYKIYIYIYYYIYLYIRILLRCTDP